MDDDWETTTVVVTGGDNFDEEEEDEAIKELEEEEKNRKEFLEKQKLKKQEPKVPKPKVEKVVKEEPRELTREELLRIREEEKKADYENAMDLLSVNNKRSIAPNASKPINEFSPKTDTEFNEFSLYLSSYIKNFENEYYYPRFIKNLMRTLCSDLSVEDLKDIQKSFSAMINEKIKESKPQKKKKASEKVSINIKSKTVDEFDNIGMSNYGYSDEEGDDDFM